MSWPPPFLAGVAAVVQQECERAGGLAARVGGDEFVALASAGQSAAAERIRARLSGLSVDLPDGGSVTASASVGVTEMGAGQSVDDALGEVDEAMYALKRRLREAA